MRHPLLRLATVFTLALSITNSADALPGDSVQAVKTSVNQHSALSPLKRGIAELSGLPFYTSQGKLPDGTIVFSMSPDRQDQRSQQETIAFGTTKPFAGFTRQNLALIQQMFNGSIAQDFERSQYVARVNYTEVEKRFYRGKTFGYTTTTFKRPNQGQQFYHFTVLPLKNLDGAIQADQQCRRQNAGGCE